MFSVIDSIDEADVAPLIDNRDIDSTPIPSPTANTTTAPTPLVSHEESTVVSQFRSALGGAQSAEREMATQEPLFNSHALAASLKTDPVYSVDTEFLGASDISMSSASLQRSSSYQNWEWDAVFSFQSLEIDYEPFREADIIGRPTRLSETNIAGQLSASLTPNDSISYDFSTGAYSGFTDHNSLWLDEYYRQQFEGIDGYLNSNPNGLNASVGIQWDSQSAAGILGATLAFQQDDVAPGYDRPIFQDLERGRERLYTSSLIMQQESVVSKFARARHQIQFTNTTDRELRYLYSVNLNLALSENWIVRAEGTATYESVEAEDQADFSAYSGGLTLEYDWNEVWFLGFTGRAYRDNGQIETSILVSSGPPPLDTSHFGISLRRLGEAVAWKLSVAAYSTRYDEVETSIRPFGNLYRNRDWTLASASLDYRF